MIYIRNEAGLTNDQSEVDNNNHYSNQGPTICLSVSKNPKQPES